MSEENKRTELPPVMLGMVSTGTPVTRGVSPEAAEVARAAAKSKAAKKAQAAAAAKAQAAAVAKTEDTLTEEEASAAPSSVAFEAKRGVAPRGAAAAKPAAAGAGLGAAAEDDPLAVLAEARAKLDQMFPSEEDDSDEDFGLVPLEPLEPLPDDFNDDQFGKVWDTEGVDFGVGFDAEGDGDAVVDADAGSDADFADDGEGEAAAAASRKKRPNVRQRAARKKTKTHPVVWVVLILAAVAVVAASVFVGWDRWFRYDDAYDIQGKWQAVGAKSAVSIKEDSIKLNKEVTYSYTMDTNNKTLTLIFGQKSGLSRYRFNMDRTQLAIMDCQEISALDALLDDLSWQLACLFASVTGGEQPSLAVGAKEAAIVLLRPDEAAALSGQDAGSSDGKDKADTSKTDKSKDKSDSSSTSKKKKEEEEKHYEPEPSTSDTGSLLDGFDVKDKPLPNELNFTGNDWL